MHGVQPSAKVTPSSGAAHRPLTGNLWMRTSRLRNDTRLSTPASSNPKMIVTTPKIWLSPTA